MYMYMNLILMYKHFYLPMSHTSLQPMSYRLYGM